MKLHEKDKRATHCNHCGFKTISKIYQDGKDNLSTIYYICELCGYKKELLMRIPPESYTTSVTAYRGDSV